MAAPPLPLWTRLWLAFACFVRVLLDGAFAGRVLALRLGSDEPAPALREPGAKRGSAKPSGARRAAGPREAQPAAEGKPERPSPRMDPLLAPLQLLALLQREGRLVDFLEQDITEFADADVGVAARVVHEGCRKVLRAHATIEPIRSEAEEARVEIALGYDPAEVKLTGKVSGKPPFQGIVRHRGWRLRDLRLPEVLAGHDGRVITPAEVEI